MIGATISHYQILEKLGEGGMGVVYKAQDTKLDRVVALKFLPSHLNASQQDKARFIHEAKAAAALNHPNICTIYGIDEHEGQMFIAMEFVDGQTLREKTNPQIINLKSAIEIGIQIAEGLAAAHEKGIVHRDIKPENIMVRKDGIVQIMDFGLAKLRASGSKISRLTKQGSTVGTAGYMSPEQIQGQDADHRSDIFSLGVLLYELFTGGLPFKGVHETALAYEIVNVDPAPMSNVKPEIDPELDRIVLECLQKEPDERYNAAKDIAKDLKRFKRESSRQKMSRVTAARPTIKASQPFEVMKPEGSPWKRNFGYVLSGLLAVVVILLMWNPWKTEEGATKPIIHSSIFLPKNAPLVGFGIAVSPDGKSLVYTAQSGQLYLHRMAELTSQPIPGAFGTVPAFSPDGQWIVFVDDRNTISKISLTGSAPEVIFQSQSFTPGLWWTADNTILFGTYSSGLAQVPVTGGTPTAVTALDSSAGEISHRFPQRLPDGKSVLYSVKIKDMDSFDDALIVAQRLSNGERKVLVKGGFYGRYLPSGHLIYVRGNTIFAVQFDPERLEVSGSPVPVVQGGVVGRGITFLGFSNNGIAVFAPSSAFRMLNTISIGWLDRAGATHSLFDTLRNYNGASLSPDGQKIAVGNASANDDIWIYDIPRGLLSRLTFGWGNNTSPVWSADGKYVMYSAEKGGIANIYRKPWDGNGSEERLTVSANPQFPVDRRSDGKFMSFNENGDIWVLPLDSSEISGQQKPYPFIQSPAVERDGFFSPDGKWMTYASDESGKPEVYVVAFPKRGGKQQISVGGGNWGLFSRNGKELFYGNGNSLMVVDVKAGSTFDFSVPRKLCTIPSNVTVWDVPFDGTKFLALINHAEQDTVSHLDVVTEWFEVVKSKFDQKGN